MPPFTSIDAASFLGYATFAWALFVSAALLSPPVADEPRPASARTRTLAKLARRRSSLAPREPRHD
ncbi:MAG: hypothetical protein QM778_29455 [Myxococcales bacterium]